MSNLFARARRRGASPDHLNVPPQSRMRGGKSAEAKPPAPKETARLRRMAEIFRRKGRPNSAEMLIWAAAVCENDPSEATIVGVLRGLIWAATRDQKP